MGGVTEHRAGPADRWVKVARVGTAVAGRTWRIAASIPNLFWTTAARPQTAGEYAPVAGRSAEATL